VDADSDNALVVRAQAGDRAAFSRLYARYAPDLYRRVLMPRCGKPEAAEEALAETFRTLLTSSARYEPHPAGPWPWLSRVAASRAMDGHRKERKKGRALANFHALVAPLVPETMPPDEATRARERADLSHKVERVLADVNPRYRQAIELRFFEELPRETCAARMNLQLGTFDVTLLRALRAFKAAWQSRESQP
jgi:RNA polymerase sigma factor (sigma-70 family)